MSSNSITTTLYVDNMTCVNCENIIERAISGRAGVKSVKASYSAGTVLISYDADVIELEKIEKAIEEHDYHVKRQKTAINEKNKEGKADWTNNITNIAGAAIIIFSLYIILKHLGLLNIFYSFPLAKEGMGYGMLFLIGLLTSIHCVAMCGGITLSQCVPKPAANASLNKFATVSPSLLYNLGRVISYTVIGGIIGALGSVVSFSGTMKGIVQILAGIFMVIMGINMLNIFPWLRKFNPRMPKIFARKINAGKNSNSPFYIGLLNGLMPCGPLQAMQLYALSTGSPVKGAISMFLFSVGTVPLMFAFGALSSFLTKKFAGRMMTASAVLVVVLGVFMFGSGASLSGLRIPVLSSITTTQASPTNTAAATVKDGVQTITTGLTAGRYEPIIVQKGIPVKWTIKAEAGDINGCNNSIVIPKFNVQKNLVEGDNVIEFTPEKSGTVPYSCWMGMIRSQITVVDDLNSVGSNTSALPDTDTTVGNDNYIDYQIPTDNIVLGKIDDQGVQTIDLTLDENGFTPAVFVIQKNLETKWNFTGINVASLPDSTLVFPYYSTQVPVTDKTYTVTLYPDQDFDFSTSDTNLFGYVKVVDDINKVDLEAIKKEVSKYRPQDYYAGGGGLPSCH